MDDAFYTERLVSLGTRLLADMGEDFKRRYGETIPQNAKTGSQADSGSMPTGPFANVKMLTPDQAAANARQRQEMLMEQKENIEGIRARLEELSKQASPEEAAKIKAQLARMEGSLSTLKQETEILEQRMSQKVSKVSSELYSVSGEVANLQKTDSEILDRVVSLQTAEQTLSGRVAGLEQFRVTAKANVEELGAGIRGLREADQKLATRLNEVDRNARQAADKLAVRIEDVDQHARDLTAKVDRRVDEAEHTIRKTCGEVRRLDGSVDNLREATGVLGKSVETLGKSQEVAANRIDGLERYAEGHEGRHLAETEHATEVVSQAEIELAGSASDLVRKWCASEHQRLVAELEQVKSILKQGFHADALARMAPVREGLAAIRESALQADLRQMERKETVRVLYQSLKQNGCKDCEIRQSDPSDPRSPVVVKATMFGGKGGKKVSFVLPFTGKMRIVIQGVKTERDAHSVYDAIQEAFGRNGLVVESPAAHSHDANNVAEAGERLRARVNESGSSA